MRDEDAVQEDGCEQFINRRYYPGNLCFPRIPFEAFFSQHYPLRLNQGLYGNNYRGAAAEAGRTFYFNRTSVQLYSLIDIG